MNLNTEQRKILKSVGHSALGRDFIDVLNQLRDDMSMVDDIENDYAAQVEGRKIFRQFARILIEAMAYQQKEVPKINRADFE